MKGMGMDAYRFSISWSRILPSKCDPVSRYFAIHCFRYILKSKDINCTMLSHLNVMLDGSLSGGVNREGIRYYNNLIDELLLKGVPCKNWYYFSLKQYKSMLIYMCVLIYVCRDSAICDPFSLGYTSGVGR